MSATDETRIALLELRVEQLQAQQNRFASHFESEERAREHLKERAALIEKALARIEDRMEQKRWTAQSIIQIIMTMTTIVSTLILIWK